MSMNNRGYVGCCGVIWPEEDDGKARCSSCGAVYEVNVEEVQ